jgi:hypothetical protein
MYFSVLKEATSRGLEIDIIEDVDNWLGLTPERKELIELHRMQSKLNEQRLVIEEILDWIKVNESIPLTPKEYGKEQGKIPFEYDRLVGEGEYAKMQSLFEKRLFDSVEHLWYMVLAQHYLKGFPSLNLIGALQEEGKPLEFLPEPLHLFLNRPYVQERNGKSLQLASYIMKNNNDERIGIKNSIFESPLDLWINVLRSFELVGEKYDQLLPEVAAALGFEEQDRKLLVLDRYKGDYTTDAIDVAIRSLDILTLSVLIKHPKTPGVIKEYIHQQRGWLLNSAMKWMVMQEKLSEKRSTLLFKNEPRIRSAIAFAIYGDQNARIPFSILNGIKRLVMDAHKSSNWKEVLLNVSDTDKLIQDILEYKGAGRIPKFIAAYQILRCKSVFKGVMR